MRNLLILLCLFSALGVYGSPIRDTVPNGLPQNTWTRWSLEKAQIKSDSGYLTEWVDTSIRPKYPMIILSRLDSGIWYWNMRKWQRPAAPITGFVRYGDSTVIFITPKQLKDSLGNYVTLYTPQSIEAQKTWDSTQTFNAPIISRLTGKVQNNFSKVDSLNNMSLAYTTQFTNRIANLNYSGKHIMAPTGVARIAEILRLNKIPDTVFLKGNQAALTSILAFQQANTSDTSFAITDNNVGGIYNAMGAGVQMSVDSTTIIAHNKRLNLDIPMAGFVSYFNALNKGNAKLYVDFDAGSTNYLDGSGFSDSAYSLNTHIGLRIRDLINNGNNINKNAIAIEQLGLLDTVRFASNKVYATNLPTATTTQILYIDANGKITKGAVPTAFNNSNQLMYNAAYKTNNYSELFNEMLKSKTIKVVKKKHKTVITISE